MRDLAAAGECAGGELAELRRLQARELEELRQAADSRLALQQLVTAAWRARAKGWRLAAWIVIGLLPAWVAGGLLVRWLH